MPAGVNLAETTIFIPRAGLTVFSHPAPADNHGRDGQTTSNRMLDVLGILSAHDLNRFNNPVITFPFE